MTKQLQIRNSTAEFLIFQAEDKAQGVQVFYQDENIWATQKAMAELYGVDRSVVTRHLKNIFESLELQQDAVSAIFAHTALDGKTYKTQFYNLDAIISVGIASTRFVRHNSADGQPACQCLKSLKNLMQKKYCEDRW